MTTTGITPAVKPISVALPKIKIDCFSGDLSSFDQFWNLFVNCVDNNPSIADCAKFSYLLSYLRGEPAELLSGLHVDSTNYSTAKDLLLKRYGDKRRLSQQYIDSFLTLPCCDGSCSSLRTFHTKLVTATRNLANNGIDIDDFSLMLSSKILSKLPEMLRIKIVESFPDDKWLVSQIITSLDKHVNIVEACNFDFDENKSNTLNSLATHSNDNRNFKPFHCVFCDGTNHKSANCRKHPDYDARIDLLKQKHLCLLCLKTGHMKKDCRSGIVCNICKMKHHDTLCSNICGFSKRKQAYNNSSVSKNHLENLTNNSYTSSDQSKNVQKSQSSTIGTNIVNAEGYTVVSQQFSINCKHSQSDKNSLTNVMLDTGSQLTFIHEKLRKI